MMSKEELIYFISEEARKHNYMDVFEKILTRSKVPLETYTEIR